MRARKKQKYIRALFYFQQKDKANNSFLKRGSKNICNFAHVYKKLSTLNIKNLIYINKNGNQ